MKKYSSLYGFLIVALITSVIVISYNFFLSKEDGFVIDNPSDRLLKIRLNEENYTIGPKQHIRVHLPKGKVSISYNIDNQNTDTLINITRHSGLINPLRQDYYTFTRPYGRRNNVDSIFTTRHFTIDNKVYLGMIEKSNQLYIENFYYNLDQDYPKIFIRGDKKTDLSKIFSKDNFKQFYFENYE